MTVPVYELILIESPTLKGRNKTNSRPDAKLDKDERMDKPIAKLIPPSTANKEDVGTHN